MSGVGVEYPTAGLRRRRPFLLLLLFAGRLGLINSLHTIDLTARRLVAGSMGWKLDVSGGGGDLEPLFTMADASGLLSQIRSRNWQWPR